MNQLEGFFEIFSRHLHLDANGRASEAEESSIVDLGPDFSPDTRVAQQLAHGLCLFSRVEHCERHGFHNPHSKLGPVKKQRRQFARNTKSYWQFQLRWLTCKGFPGSITGERPVFCVNR